MAKISEGHNSKFVCRRCLISYISDNVLIKHKQRCEKQEVRSIRISNDSHLNLKKKHFHKNPIYFRIYAVLEAENIIDNSSKGDEKTIIYQQNPVCNGYYLVSDIEDVLKSGYYESSLAYYNVDWLVGAVIRFKKWLPI